MIAQEFPRLGFVLTEVLGIDMDEVVNIDPDDDKSIRQFREETYRNLNKHLEKGESPLHSSGD